jgi:hypothetical protein
MAFSVFMANKAGTENSNLKRTKSKDKLSFWQKEEQSKIKWNSEGNKFYIFSYKNKNNSVCGQKYKRRI